MDNFASGSIRNQLAVVYSSNLEAENPFRVYLCGNEESTPCLDVLLEKLAGIDSWPAFSIHRNTDVQNLFDQSLNLDLVYPSPDAEEPLMSVESDKVYVIGGLCDRDRKRNVTKQKCKEFNLTC